ncbi:MAG: class II histone deacetylase [Paracoccaceae bacterium]|nr:class II histone deacetylase [Paracoccaceae bacterium]
MSHARQTGFFWSERTFWHGGGNYASVLPVGGMVEPLAAGGLPESPEAKRRLKSLVDVSGLGAKLAMAGAEAATEEDLLRVHASSYIHDFRSLSDRGGGEIGLRAPFGPGGYDIAALSAGLAVAAIRAVASGDLKNAYALCRPPGHHCLPEWPNGFCLLANIAVGVEAALAEGRTKRVAILDWDVHHGNGTEAIFWERGDVLTVSIHQERNYPLDTGGFEARGSGPGTGANLNIPLPPGAGHLAWMAALERLALPAIEAFRPDLVVVASGYDAAFVDPLGRMVLTAESFRAMTEATMALADNIAGGRLVLVHEGGYSDVYAPFCAHAAIAALAGEAGLDDPFGAATEARQPSDAANGFFLGLIDAMAEAL